MEGDSHDQLNIGLSRPDATGRDEEEYTVSVQEAAELFAASGLPRTDRAVQRYCKKGELKCAPVDTIYGSKYLITRTSVERLILQKQQAQQLTPETSSADMSRPVASGRDWSRHGPGVVHELREEKTQTGSAQTDNRSHDRSGDSEERHGATKAKDALELQKLREENLGLKIDAAGKQAFINQLVTERQQLMTTTQELS